MRAPRGALLLLWGCASRVEIAQAPQDVDACEPLCVRLSGEPGASWRLAVGPLEASGALDEAGQAEACWEPPLPLGAWVAGLGDGPERPVRVRPFGWRYGLDRPVAPLGELPWVPALEGLADGPLLSPEEGRWDSLSVMAASVTRFRGRHLLYYAGTDEEDFHLGVAEEGAEGWVRLVDAPLLDPSSRPWRRFAQSTPEVEVVGDALWLWYTGRAREDGGLSIGLATSADGVVFTDHPDNPVLTGTGHPGDFDAGGVAHPSVVVRDGLFELWYASGTLQVGHALSLDGVHWERSCAGPVWTGDPDGWDGGQVKAPEVWWDGALYWMTYSGGGKGAYQVGWMASADGTRWVDLGAPLLSPSSSAWATQATQEAYLEPDDQRIRLWYTGNDGVHQQIGAVWLEGVQAPPPASDGTSH
ncbi:MAG: hypothetical protein JXX28_09855 [Deltaproteobacteria bacterium]|nr:hypothetical protein [Deltaproteobacteria bacterium]